MLQCALSLLGIWAVLAYFRAPLWALALSGLSLMFLFWFDASLPWWQWSLCLALLLALLGLLASPTWRMRLISRRVGCWMASAMPGISRTEREALEAGKAGWERTFFSGMPDWQELLTRKTQPLSDEEQAFLDGPLEELCARLHDWEIHWQRHDLPPDVWRMMRQMRLFGMIIPKRYGGLGFSARAHSAVIAKLASRNVSAAVTAMVPNSLGPAELLLRYGTDAQREALLPRLASGEEIPCFALTAAEAGSDAAAMRDHGVICRNDAGEIGIRLNWNKRYITLAPVATLLGLAFKLYDPEHLLGEEEEIGITLALIPVDTPGVRIGKRHLPMGLAFMNGPTEGHDVWISLEQVIGGRDQLGKGWRMLMECLGSGRGISLPAMATGAAQKCAYCCGAYARIRRQFHLPIGRFEGVESAMACIAGHSYIMNAAREFAVQNMDAGEVSTIASSILKYHSTERMRLCVNAAMDIHGGKGISQGPSNYLGEMYQALPIGITVEGANILTRSLIIFGQGVLRCHPYLLTEMRHAAAEDEASAARFDQALFSHVGMLLSNAVRSLWLGLTHAQFTHVPASGPEARYYQHATRLSAALALCADVSLITLGSAFKRREAISARLGDAFSQLYMMAAALKYFRDHGHHKDELPLLQWACEDALWRAQQALDGVLSNLPHRALAWLLRRLVFPWGLCFSPPADWLNHQVAANMMIPAVNHRISRCIYRPQDETDPLRRLNEAWHACIAAEDAERKLEQAVRKQLLQVRPGEDDSELVSDALQQGILSEHEAETLLRAIRLRQQVIAVDAFDAQTLQNMGNATSNPSVADR